MKKRKFELLHWFTDRTDRAVTFAGNETFHETAGDYTSGEADFEYRFKLVQGDTEVAALNRRVKLTLEPVTAKGN